MSELNVDPNAPEQQPEIAVNQHDGVVAVEEADRTVLLTPNETIIVEKQPVYDIAPTNRPKKVYGGMWGPAEIGVVGIASLAIMAALATYFFFTLPAKRELERNRATRDRLEAELVSARSKYGDITNTEAQVAKLDTSVRDFESTFLPVAANGRTTLYQKLNGLIAGYGLVNTSGPDYAPLDLAVVGENNNSEEERGRSRFRSLFPGTYVTMTLEGPYGNLRRFIREIETGNDFVIISAIELVPSDSEPVNAPSTEQTSQVDTFDQGLPPGMGRGIQNQVKRPSGRTLGQVVSLRMEMAAYFRRPNVEAQTTVVPPQ
ncbi:MAG: hypothetical protein ABIR33_04320 [Pyrinomonadaceae bacterium]